MTGKSQDVRDILKGLSQQDFLKVGLDQIAYIKPIEVDATDRPAYSICAADGSEIFRMDTIDMALAAVRHNDLHPVTLH